MDKAGRTACFSFIRRIVASDLLQEMLPTCTHTGSSLGTPAQLQFVRLTGSVRTKKETKKEKSSPFIFLGCQKGAKGFIVFLQLGTAEQNIDTNLTSLSPDFPPRGCGRSGVCCARLNGNSRTPAAANEEFLMALGSPAELFGCSDWSPSGRDVMQLGE